MKSKKVNIFLLRGKCILIVLNCPEKDNMLVHFAVVFAKAAVAIHMLGFIADRKTDLADLVIFNNKMTMVMNILFVPMAMCKQIVQQETGIDDQKKRCYDLRPLFHCCQPAKL